MIRKPRFKRTPAALEFQLTTRDREIMQHVAAHRFLSSRQILALVAGSSQHVLRRLQSLFHLGYLDRPRAQLRYFSEEGPQAMVYALGRAGTRSLAVPGKPRTRYDNRNVKQLYLQHTLVVADVLIAFIRACRVAPRPKLLNEDQLAPSPASRLAFQWSVTVRHARESKRVGVVPDRTFALESRTTGERVLFFIEADRATMPLTRRSLAQSSLQRKLLAYEATWNQELLRDRFSCSRFRVLLVTSSAERARHLVEVCATIPRGRGLFLVTDADTLSSAMREGATTDVLDLPWLCADGGTEQLSELWTTPLGQKQAA